MNTKKHKNKRFFLVKIVYINNDLMMQSLFDVYVDQQESDFIKRPRSVFKVSFDVVLKPKKIYNQVIEYLLAFSFEDLAGYSVIFLGERAPLW